MRLTGLGKLILLIMVVGVAVGGWRVWKNTSGGGTQGDFGSRVSNALKDLGSKVGQSRDNASTSGTGNPESSTSSDSSGGSNNGDIEFIITAAKKDWVQEQVDKFNASNGGKWHVSTKPIPSRQAMKAILSGKEKPVLWSPGSPIWPARLAEVWQQRHPNSSLLEMNDPNAYRLFLRSPLVFLTTTEKAKFLRPLLGGSHPWASVRELSMGKKRVPWGTFRFSHADPLTSSSGMLTLGLALVEYGEQTGQSGSLGQIAKGDPKFITYLKEMERGLIYDADAQAGTTALTKAFLADTGRYDFITAYESAALDGAATYPNLAVIYPNPTSTSEHAVSLLNGDWVTPDQREGALALLKFMGSPEALKSGIHYNFRPAAPGTTLSLSDKLSQSSHGFQQSFTSTELPSYETLNNAAFLWRIHIAHKPPTEDE